MGKFGKFTKKNSNKQHSVNQFISAQQNCTWAREWIQYYSNTSLCSIYAAKMNARTRSMCKKQVLVEIAMRYTA